ncbi:MAG: acyltransferase [Nocardioides sp.]
MKGRLGDVFDTHPNALNLIRLMLALQVVAWHAFSLQGRELPERLGWFVSDVGVDGFFAISGLLICRAWLRRPTLGSFLASRARRILPGLWVCLVVTAFCVVPLACWAGSHPGPTWAGSSTFVVQNAGIVVHQWGIDNTTSTLPVDGWNGSLWTLMWEALCYVLIAALGVVSALRARVVLYIFAVVWAYQVALTGLGVEPYSGSIWHWMPARASLMFLSGVALWLCRDRVPFDGRWAALAATTIPLSVCLLPDYRVVAAPAVAYLLVWSAVSLAAWDPRLVLRADLSYGVYIYAFPLQQALLLVGFETVHWLFFLAVSAVLVLPVAGLSWRFVEAPALRRRPAVSPETRDGQRLQSLLGRT